jgi:hypothetical protein
MDVKVACAAAYFSHIPVICPEYVAAAVAAIHLQKPDPVDPRNDA